MAKVVGFNRYLAVKSQVGWGIRATGLATTLIALRSGGILQPNAFKQPREDAIYALSPLLQHYDAPKFVPWQASGLFVNPTSAANSLRDFFRTIFGLETLVAGPPITKTYTIFDPPIDGATDTGTLLYGRGLTIHEEGVDSTGAKIYADTVQDGVLSELSVTWRPDMPLLVGMRGMASDLRDNQPHISPTIPAGTLFTYRHLKDTVNGGLRIGTANPPVAADNCIFSQAVLTISNALRYVNYMGNGAQQSISCTAAGTTTLTSAALFGSVGVGMLVTGPGVTVYPTYVTAVASSSSITVSNAVTAGAEPQARVFTTQPEAVLPTRDGQMGITLDVTMDVENPGAGQYDSEDAFSHWRQGTGLNIDFLTYADASNILQFKASAATAACFIESVQRQASGLGAMQIQLKLRVAPAALTDVIMKLTNAS